MSTFDIALIFLFCECIIFDINRKMQRNNKDNEMNPNKEERLNDNQNQENQEDGIRRKRKRVNYKHRLQLRNSQVQQEQNLERTEDRESRRNSLNFVNVNSTNVNQPGYEYHPPQEENHNQNNPNHTKLRQMLIPMCELAIKY